MNSPERFWHQFAKGDNFGDRIFETFQLLGAAAKGKNLLPGSFNPFASNGIFYHNSLDQPVSNNRVSGQFL